MSETPQPESLCSSARIGYGLLAFLLSLLLLLLVLLVLAGIPVSLWMAYEAVTGEMPLWVMALVLMATVVGLLFTPFLSGRLVATCRLAAGTASPAALEGLKPFFTGWPTVVLFLYWIVGEDIRDFLIQKNMPQDSIFAEKWVADTATIIFVAACWYACRRFFKRSVELSAELQEEGQEKS